MLHSDIAQEILYVVIILIFLLIIIQDPFLSLRF